MTDAERRALDDEAQLIALAKAEEAGTLPPADRRHEPKADVGNVPIEPAPVEAEVAVVEAPAEKLEIPNDQIHIVQRREDGVKVNAGGSIHDEPLPPPPASKIKRWRVHDPEQPGVVLWEDEAGNRVS